MSIRLTGLASGLDTDSMVQELVSAYSLKKENYEKQQTKLEWKQEIWKDLNKSIYSFYTSSLSSLRRASSFTNKKSCTVSDSTKATVTATGKVPNGTQHVEIKSLAKASYLTGSKVDRVDGTDAAVNSGTKLNELGIQVSTLKVKTADGTVTNYVVSSDMTIGDFTEDFKNKTGLNISFDSSHNQFIVNSESGAKNNFEFVVESQDDYDDLSAFGLATAEQIQTWDADNYVEGETPVAYKQNGSDALFVINGATYESESNSITVNGLTINALGETNGPMTITTSQDTDGIYDMVKEFVDGYNKLINDITAKYNAKTAKGYEPLTDDEREAMSETEIEKWENKIKDSLLRRDDTLNSVMNIMTSSMSAGIEIDGKTYYLSNFGISTQGFLSAEENQHNAYHIDGNKDDSVSADNTDKLRKMIETDPDLVAKFFNELSSKLYDSLTTKMSSSTLSSAYTIYNDKQMDDEMKELESTIKDWEEELTDYEDYWYDKFSAMETALAELQNQTSQLTSLLGG